MEGRPKRTRTRRQPEASAPSTGTAKSHHSLGEPTTSAGQVKASQGRQVSTDRNQNKKKKVSYKEKSTDDEDSDFQPTPIRTPAKKKVGKPSTLVSKNGGKTPTTPSGKLKGKMLAARKVKAPQTSSSESGSEDNDEDFVANPKEEKRRKVARAKTRKKTPSNKGSAADDEKPHYSPERDANQKTLCLEPSNWMQVINGYRGQGRLGFSAPSYRATAVEASVGRSSVVNQVKQMRVYKSVAPFNRRLTAVAWHPHEPNVCAIGSKGGSVLIWNHTNDSFGKCYLDTDHPGGSIQNMKFDFWNRRKVYTCSIDGTFLSREFREGSGAQDHEVKKFLETGSYERWYTSFDVSFVGKTMLAGNNVGYVTLMCLDSGEQLWQKKLHKGKVSHIGFSPREPWMFVTASIDHLVKVWDIRMMQDRDDTTKAPDPLQTLLHEKAVNNAEFSHVDGTRLLTTDQHSQLRVYRSPHWTLEKIIPHPHRQFQHLTPVRATWHPLVDAVVAGRYPDPAFPGTLPGELRTVDFFDPDTGDVMHQLSEPNINKIMSLNRFNCDGSALLSCAGLDALIWKVKPDSDPLAEADQEEGQEGKTEYRVSSKEGVRVEEWPGYKPQPKARKKKEKE